MMMRVAGAVTVALLLLAGAGGATAQTTSFPAALEREALLVWLQRETDIPPDQVVAVTPQALTSIMSRFPAGAGAGPRLVIRAEALSPELQSRTGALSWHVSLNADCQSRLIKLGETTGYSQRNLLGARKVLRAADTAWRKPEAGAAVEQAWRAACEPGFMGPFESSAVKLAQAENASSPSSMTSASSPISPSDPAAATPVVRVVPAPRKATVSRPVLPVSTRSSGPAVQLAAVTSDAAARALLSGLKASLSGRTTWVEKAEVSGRAWYRVMVGGFADSGEAARFCGGLKASGRSCFVRSGI